MKLSTEEQRQVEEIEQVAEKRLRDEHEVAFDMNETRATTPETVWHEVVARAVKAGWVASIAGATVKIRRPD